MARFSHIADVHLGGWKQEQMCDLNLQSFKMAIERSIKEKVDFVLVAGDLFDSAFPPIETLKDTFSEFKKLKDAKIPCYLIAGSHDYSVSGKTFLDVLERTGFCKNVESWEEIDGKIVLSPTIHENIAIYGYPGKKAGLEVQDLGRVKFNEAPGLFKIFMLHTTLDRVIGSLPIDSVDSSQLPKADYYALGHIHVEYFEDGFCYPGPIFPNNFAELEDLEFGRFVIVDTNNPERIQKIELKIKDVLPISVEVSNALTATEKIISELDSKNIENKLILLRVFGELKNGKHSDIKFQDIEEHAKKKNAFFLLRNTHDLKAPQVELEIEVKSEENIEEEVIKIYSEENPSDFNSLIPEFMNCLSVEKQEDEKTEVFTNRLLSGAKRVMSF